MLEQKIKQDCLFYVDLENIKIYNDQHVRHFATYNDI